MPTASELAALDYNGSSAFAKGMTATDYQRSMLEPHGEVPRWWKAFAAPSGTVGPNDEVVERNGHLYIEQELSASALVYVEQTAKEVYDVEFGLMTQGQTQIACNPAYMELARGDRIALPSRLMVGRTAFTPDSSSSPLGRRYVAEITEVIYAGVVLEPDTYELDETETGEGLIKWLGTAPASTVLIEFRYNPLYTCLGISDRNPPRGADGERLLQRTILTLEQKIEDDEA